ncbi:MAG: FAD-binding protein, partial [candidate division Zixibacteria bacterium]|nr:FAD-binding protein [candidate division Zixibacteria bacterium]
MKTTAELSRAVALARRTGIPYVILGDGSNLLVSDDGYRGVIIRNRITGLAVQGSAVTAGAGESLDGLVDF